MEDIGKEQLPIITLTQPTHEDQVVIEELQYTTGLDQSHDSSQDTLITREQDKSAEEDTERLVKTGHIVEASDSFKLVHDVISLAKRWKKRTQATQARKEIDLQAEQEQRKALAALHLPKNIICDIIEETLAIVVKTEHRYRHHLGSKHTLTVKAMEKANSLCTELGKGPIYTHMNIIN